jgi:hypothetical protein
MMLTNKVEAIKAIRETRNRVRIIYNGETNRHELNFNMDLREEKELVEAIMALGVRSFLNDTKPLVELVNRLQEAIK